MPITRNYIGCHIHAIGRRATEIIGGDRETLTPGKHFVENCRIHNFGRLDRTYVPAIQLEGVGNRVAHNLLYDSPSSVLRVEGNDHIFEFNEIHTAVTESDDQGAVDMFNNPVSRGNVFRYNHFHDIGKVGDEASVHGQAAIRFDDIISGQVVYGNIFERSSKGNFGAVQIHAGRDNIMDNNIFYGCKYGVSGGWNPNHRFWRSFEDGTHRLFDSYYDAKAEEIHISRYPAIEHMLDEKGTNHVWRNIFYDCPRAVYPRYGSSLKDFDMMGNVEYDHEDAPVFIDARGGDFRLRPDAPWAAEIGFRPIPVDQIGLYEDR